MGLQIIKKTSAPRANTGVPRDLEYNDIVFRVGEAKGEAKDEFRISPTRLESTGLKDADKGGALLFDDEKNEFYLAVVPKEAAEIFKPRENKNKTTNFQHKDALEIMVSKNLIPADRQIGYVTAFKMVEAPELVSAIEGATAVFKLEQDTVVSRLLSKDEKATSEETTQPAQVAEQAAAETQSAPQTENVASTEEGWDE